MTGDTGLGSGQWDSGEGWILVPAQPRFLREILDKTLNLRWGIIIPA